MSAAAQAVSARQHLAPGVAAGVSEEMIAAVVDAFYARIRTDPTLGPIFAHRIARDAWPRHLQRMCAFWSSVLLMTGRFKGAPMAAHAAIPGLGPAHFAHWLVLFEETAIDTCPPAAAALFVARAKMIAQSLQLGLAAARGELPDVRDFRT
jgi:hemoglobin